MLSNVLSFRSITVRFLAFIGFFILFTPVRAAEEAGPQVGAQLQRFEVNLNAYMAVTHIVRCVPSAAEYAMELLTGSGPKHFEADESGFNFGGNPNPDEYTASFKEGKLLFKRLGESVDDENPISIFFSPTKARKEIITFGRTLHFGSYFFWVMVPSGIYNAAKEEAQARQDEQCRTEGRELRRRRTAE